MWQVNGGDVHHKNERRIGWLCNNWTSGPTRKRGIAGRCTSESGMDVLIHRVLKVIKFLQDWSQNICKETKCAC